MRAGFSPYAAKKRGGNTGRPGPDGDSAAHIAMLQTGYAWDKEQNWYFKTGVDADGKQYFDRTQPAGMDLYRSAMQRAGIAQGIGGAEEAKAYTDAVERKKAE